jgi:hypothetical protein
MVLLYLTNYSRENIVSKQLLNNPKRCIQGNVCDKRKKSITCRTKRDA